MSMHVSIISPLFLLQQRQHPNNTDNTDYLFSLFKYLLFFCQKHVIQFDTYFFLSKKTILNIVISIIIMQWNMLLLDKDYQNSYIKHANHSRLACSVSRPQNSVQCMFSKWGTTSVQTCAERTVVSHEALLFPTQALCCVTDRTSHEDEMIYLFLE